MPLCGMNGYFVRMAGLFRFIERCELRPTIAHEESAQSSRIPPACSLDYENIVRVFRWFSLHRCAVSLHHRLISVLPPGAGSMAACWQESLIMDKTRHSILRASIKNDECVRLRRARHTSQIPSFRFHQTTPHSPLTHASSARGHPHSPAAAGYSASRSAFSYSSLFLFAAEVPVAEDGAATFFAAEEHGMLGAQLCAGIQHCLGDVQGDGHPRLHPHDARWIILAR